MNMLEKFETVRNIMKKHNNAKFDGTSQLIESTDKDELYIIRNEIIRSGIDEVYDIVYHDAFKKYFLSLHLTKGRSW